MFSYIDLESRIPQEHPIRKIRKIVDQSLEEIEVLFDDMYAVGGRLTLASWSSVVGSLVSPLVAAKTSRGAIDGRTTLTEGYRVSQRKRKRVEECFGWMKTFGLMHKLRHRGMPKVNWVFRLTASAYNITRLKAYVWMAEIPALFRGKLGRIRSRKCRTAGIDPDRVTTGIAVQQIGMSMVSCLARGKVQNVSETQIFSTGC